MALASAAHPGFATACLVAAAVGLRRDLGSAVRSCVVAGLIVFVLAGEPVLFARSHDIILLLALSGIALLAGFAPSAAERDRVVAIIYVASITAGGMTTLTATHSLLNFCIGGLPAAILAVTASPDSARNRAVAARTALTAAAFVTVSLSHFYGEPAGQVRGRERVDWGVFAGLAARPEQVALLTFVRDQLAPRIGDESGVAVLGRFPGLVLATPARTRMPVPYPLSILATSEGVTMVQAFYEHHPPALVLEYRDGAARMLNPIGPRFAEWYQARETHDVANGTLTIFVRQQPGVPHGEP